MAITKIPAKIAAAAAQVTAVQAATSDEKSAVRSNAYRGPVVQATVTNLSNRCPGVPDPNRDFLGNWIWLGT